MNRADEQPGVSWDETRWVLIFAALVMLATTIPYLIGFANQGDAWRFTGFLFNVDDGNSYIAKMLSGAHGAWLFRTPYTALPQDGVLAFLLYILLGKLTAPPGQHEQLVALFHLFRVSAGFFAVWATYLFLSLFLADTGLRRWAVVLATLGGGLGWVLVSLGRVQWLDSLPLEFYSPESFGFLSLYGLPHLALARGLLMLGLWVYLSRPPARDWSAIGEAGSWFRSISDWWSMRRETDERVLVLKIGVLWSAMALAQPLSVVVAWLILCAHLAGLAFSSFWLHRASELHGRHLFWATVRRAFWTIGASSPIIAYTIFKFRSDPILRIWTDQNLIISPHPAHYLLAYGLLSPLALWGAKRLVKEASWSGWLPVAWVASLPFLAYAPFNLQRRLPEGIWIAFCVLGLAGVKALSERNRKLARFAKYALLTSVPSTIMLLAGGLLTAGQVSEPVFRPADEVMVFQELADRALRGEAVLSAFETGNALPAWSPQRVVIGHGPESVGLAELRPQVSAFYQSQTSDEIRTQFVQDYGIRYVVWGPSERALGDWEPRKSELVRLLTAHGGYTLFEVNSEGAE